MKKQIAIPDVEASIARRSEIKSRIQSIIIERGSLPVQQLGAASQEAITNDKYFVDRYGHGNEENIPEGKRAEYRPLKESAKNKSAAYLLAKQKDEALLAELAELNSELETIGRKATAGDVLMYQAEAADIESDINKLRQIIAREENNVALGNTCSEGLNGLHREREDLMADIAIGNSSDQQRLDDIEVLIAKEEAQIRETKNVAAAAKIIIAGLQRKVDDSAQSLAKVREKLQMVYGDFLICEAEKEGGEFAALSDKLWEKYSRLLALGTMIERHPTVKGPSIISAVSRNLRVPSFNLKSCLNGCRADGFRYTSNPFNVNTAIEDAKRDIAALGINTAIQ